MAIYINDGVLGGGKTYGAVHWFADNFCVQLKDGRYIVDPDKNIRVITNIDGFKIPHEDFLTCLTAAGGFNNFFTRPYQDSFSDGRHIIYLLDEAQQWFRPKYCHLTEENLLYFEWSRHKGHDFYLITQSYKKINTEVSCLAEFISTVQPRSLKFVNEFTYLRRTFDGVDLGVHRIVFRKKIGQLYKTAELGEAVKIKNPILRRLLLAVFVIVLMIGFGGYRTYKIFRRNIDGSPSSPGSVHSSSFSPDPASSLVSSSSFVDSSAKKTDSLGSGILGRSSKDSIDYYMYRLDVVYSRSGMMFLLGMSWIPRQTFPYRVVRKGYNYFAVIPSSVLSVFEDSSRAIPLDLSQ